MCSDLRPRLIGVQVSPPSSVRKAPAAEMAMKMRFGILRIQQDRVQTHAARTRCPMSPRSVTAKSRELLPRLSAVGGPEQGGILDACIYGIGVGQRRLQMPDALELPRVGRAIVPLMRARNAGVGELVPDGFPGLSAIARSLNLLAKPAARLRGIDPAGLNGRAFHMVDLPSREMRAANVPGFACTVRFQNESAFSRSDQNPHCRHPRLPFSVTP